jgi:hypothetical protein
LHGVDGCDTPPEQVIAGNERQPETFFLRRRHGLEAGPAMRENHRTRGMFLGFH